MIRQLKTLFDDPYNKRHPVDALTRLAKWSIGKRLGKPWTATIWKGKKVYMYPDSSESMWLSYRPFLDWNEFQFLGKYLRSDDVVLDIGANIGIYTLWISSFVTGGRIVAFEPDGKNFERFNSLIRLNSLPNVTIVKSAVSDTTGKTLFTQTKDLENHIIRNSEQSTNVIEVQCLTLDEYAAAHDIDRINFMKVDVEGAELFVLQGANRLLSRGVIDLIQLEVNNQSHKFGYTAQVLLDYLKTSGLIPFVYQIETEQLSELTSDSGLPQNIFAAKSLDLVRKRLRG